MPRRTSISTPSRLHFGLFSLESQPGDASRSFGGLGAMIAEPRVKVTIEEAAGFSCHGSLVDRAEQFANHWLQDQLSIGGEAESKLPCCIDELRCRITISAPQHHTGLGVGTQLALSIAAALNAQFDLPMPAAAELALSMNRGRRSAVGSYGFATGGLIVDGGRESDAAFPDLSGRFDIPTPWRFVLIRPQVDHEFFGATEKSAFGKLPKVTGKQRNELTVLAQNELIPAVIQKNFGSFAQSLGRFNFLSGSLFAPLQGGAYHGQLLTKLVAGIQNAGYHGVGQSSWGPTLFVAASNDAMANEIAACAKQLLSETGQTVSSSHSDLESETEQGRAEQGNPTQGSETLPASIHITPADNTGHKIVVDGA